MVEARVQPLSVGRYLLYRQIARGGMATIHIARLMGDVGFSRIVAAKRLHPELAGDAEFVTMFLDEARVASKVHHRNVVPVLDVVTLGSEVVLVQEYVHGAPLSLLLKTAHLANTHIPIPVAAAIACHILAGLHAAHETCDEMGVPLEIVHRDVSPQNVMVATDGTARLLDFGVAKATMAAHVTRQGTFKGKLAYSAPEHVRGDATPQSDIYSLSVVLWELIVGHRMHATKVEHELIAEIMTGALPTITSALAEEQSRMGNYRWSQLEALEPIIRKGLASDLRRRWATAAAMEEAITAAVPLASATDVAAWLKAIGKDFLDGRDQIIAEEEASWRKSGALPRAMSPASPEPREPLQHPMAWLRRASIYCGIAALLAIGFAMLSRAREPSAAPASTAPASATPPSFAAPVTTSTMAIQDLPPAPAPTAPPTAPPLPPARPRSLPSVSPSGPPPSPPSVPRIVHVRAVHPTPRASQCNPPYYFEGEKKIFKPACL